MATPVNSDEIDPELVNLRRRVPVGPLLAASVLGFAVLLMVRLRADFVYAGRGTTPDDSSSPADNTLVEISGRIDASAPLFVRGAHESGQRLAPLLGSGGRIWIDELGEAGEITPRYDDRWLGRLRRLDATPFAAALVDFLAQAPPVPRVVVGLTEPGLPKLDAAGDPVVTSPDTRVTIEEIVAETSRVVFVKTDDIPDEAAARKALVELGVVPQPPIEATNSSWIYEVGEAAAPLGARLRAARRFGAAAQPKISQHEGVVRELDLGQPDHVRLATARIPRTAIRRMVFWTPRTLPAETWVVFVGELPSALWYTRPLYAVLALIALLMIWALVTDFRHLRRNRPKSQPVP